MPLSLNEIRDRALAFSRDWAGTTSERAEAQSFWNAFFNVFGVDRRRVAVFEQKAKRFSGSQHGRIDVFWPGVMLAEHKSTGQNLDAAYDQALDYFAGLKDAELPRHVVVSDFHRLRVVDLNSDVPPLEFPLADLHRHIGRFGFISGYQTRVYAEQDPVNMQAAERMGRLHDALKSAGYDGHALEVLLVRLLFCLFADDTGIFPRHAFHDLIDQRTSADGADLGMWIARLFQILDTPEDKRQKTEDEQLRALPYVNGLLFRETLPLAAFNAQMRTQLLEASALDWSRISPAIFGSMFQSVMEPQARRNLGAHYTSEKNILKLIGPLFLDELQAELDKAGNDVKKLAQLHAKLAKLEFLDPACGCGNFLVIAYRELRLLELEVLKRQFATQQSVLAHVQDHVLVDVDQFFGIEIEEFPAQIAQVAMWLMDHQMNLRVAQQFGENVLRLPLKKSATIVHGNALQLDWNEVVRASELDYVLGNPPFSGAMVMDDQARAAFGEVFADLKGAGVLDFVAAWYWLAAKYIHGTDVEVGFVSTNSIVQGEQVGLLWRPMLDRYGVHINFAHRTFKWSNEARGKAAVHCVIIGFAFQDAQNKSLFDYETIDGEPHRLTASNINPYLIEAQNTLLENRSEPISRVPGMRFGSMPRDGGNLLFTQQEYKEFIASEPLAQKWIRPYVGADEFLNGGWRWCLWLKDAGPSDLRVLPLTLARIEATRKFRLASKAATTQKFAKMPALFCQIAQPETRYLLVPGVSSERRTYIPIGFMDANVIANNLVFVVPDASQFHLGIISSLMHMAWVRAVCGRLESRYRYSAGIVYNNFPWPELGEEGDGTNKHRAAIESAAQGVLDARAQFPDATLADLYDPLSMPPVLVKAHQQLDKAVDAAYIAAEKSAGRKVPKLTTDAERVAFLFERYQALTSLLPVATANKPRRSRQARRNGRASD